jgi:outer membrane protein assembly factor BamB
MAYRQLAWIVVLSLAECAGRAGQLTAADWPQFLGPTRNGTTSETGLLTQFPQDGPPLVWEKAVGSGYSGPVVSGDRLILFHRVDDREVIECLEAATGKNRWKFDYETNYQDAYAKGNGPRSTPLIAEGRVFTLGAGGQLHCLDLASGKKIWDRALNTEYHVKEGFFGVATSPLVDHGRLLINVGGPNAGIVAFAADTGKELWKATGDDASYASPVTVTMDGKELTLFFTRDGVVILDPATGTVKFKQRWRARISASVNAASPIVGDDLAFFSSSYQTGALVLQLTKNSATKVWSNDESLSCHYNTPVLHAGMLYGIDGRQEERPRLRCVALKTGKVHWTKEQFGCASLILADRRLFALTEDGDLVMIDPTPQAYREMSRAKVLKPTCRAEAALAGGRLFARDESRLGCWLLAKPGER